MPLASGAIGLNIGAGEGMAPILVTTVSHASHIHDMIDSGIRIADDASRAAVRRQAEQEKTG
jgi:hypothetical protein